MEAALETRLSFRRGLLSGHTPFTGPSAASLLDLAITVNSPRTPLAPETPVQTVTFRPQSSSRPLHSRGCRFSKVPTKRSQRPTIQPCASNGLPVGQRFSAYAHS